MAALFAALNFGNLANITGGAKLEVQQNVRRAMEWIIRDLRQTKKAKLTVYNSLGQEETFLELDSGEVFTKPKFEICTGYNTTTKSAKWSDEGNEIGYDFDSGNRTIVRKDYATENEWRFNYIDDLTFARVDKAFNVNALSVTISGKKTARGTIEPTFNLTAEVRLRNE